jgi:hypothetical protein
MTAVAGPVAGAARFVPDLAAAAATLTGRPYRKLERDGGADVSLPLRESNLSAEAMSDGVRLDERVAHPLDTFTDGREIERHFVGK